MTNVRFRFPKYKYKYPLLVDGRHKTLHEGVRTSLHPFSWKDIRAADSMSRAAGWIPVLWRETFHNLLADELDSDDQWSLGFSYSQTATLTDEQRKRGWKVHSKPAHAEFQCGSCYKTWHSAKVTLLFHYRLRGGRGTVIMRPFGQACRKCKSNRFSLPGLSGRDMEEALLRLLCKIQKNCYGIDDGSVAAYAPRPDKFTDPHEASLCEACIKGICSRDTSKQE